MTVETGNLLGSAPQGLTVRLHPAAFGFARTPADAGLRRQEVAERAKISPTWAHG